MIKVGQIRKDEFNLYVITYDLTNCGIVYQNGEVGEYTEKLIEQDKLIAEYPTWQEAVNSPEFKRREVMKLLKITGDTNKIIYEEEHDYWSYDEENKPYAILEVETNGIEGDLTFQAIYRIYRNKKGKLYCNVRKKRVFLEDLGFKEQEQ